MLKIVKYLFGAGLMLGGTAAMAGDLPPEFIEGVMQTCRPDYHRVCSYVVPGDGRVGRCLLDHETELAPPCLKAVKLAYAIEVCLPDYHRFCGGVPPGGGQIAECLAERMEALAPDCQRVVAANLPYSSGHGDRYGYSRPAVPYGDEHPYPRYGTEYGHERGYDDRYVDRSSETYRDDRYVERERGYYYNEHRDHPEAEEGPGPLK